jgi:uncharacterized membrane protein (UPF0127 family)
VWLVASCSGDGEATEGTAATTAVTPQGFEREGVTFALPDGRDLVLDLWIAESTDERSRGLMGVTDLGGADGMLFEFEQAGPYRFWMWQTPLPLDIAFFGADGDLVGTTAMAPCTEPLSSDCPRYDPGAPFLVALEVPAGDLEVLGIEAGASITEA